MEGGGHLGRIAEAASFKCAAADSHSRHHGVCNLSRVLSSVLEIIDQGWPILGEA